MARFISINGDVYGIWSDTNTGVVGNAVPASIVTAAITTAIAQSQSEHKQADAKRS